MKMSKGQETMLDRLDEENFAMATELDGRTTRALVNNGWSIVTGTGEKTRVKITAAGRKVLDALD